MGLLRKKYWYSTMDFKRLLIACIGVFLLATCRKDAPVPEEDGCYTFPVPPISSGFQYSYPHYLFREPCFNPLNSDEFVYVREIRENSVTTELWKHIISTDTDIFLALGAFGHPQWGATGYVLFTRPDNKIWRIKINGDSLIQLTFGTGYDLSPLWNGEGDRFIYSGNNQPLIADIDGNTIDTVPVHGDWSADGTKLCFVAGSGGSGHIAYYQITTGEMVNVASVPIDESVWEVYWKSDSRTIYWNTSKGFYKTDIAAMNTTKIRASCDSRRWTTFQFSGDGQKMIWERIDSKLTGSDHNTIYQENNIFLLNPDGTGEQKIDIQ
ncbi:hypothetical protein BH11BAC7_BH11BAC7_11370 [soil metagenome]